MLEEDEKEKQAAKEAVKEMSANTGDKEIHDIDFPMGDNKSTILMAVLVFPHSIRRRSSGKIGVISSKFVLRIAFKGKRAERYIYDEEGRIGGAYVGGR